MPTPFGLKLETAAPFTGCLPMNKFRHTIAAFTVQIVLPLFFLFLRDPSDNEEKVHALPVADLMKTPDKPANGNPTDISDDTIRGMKAGMKETLEVPGARFRLRFEDGGQPELTDDLRQQITGDLQLIFGDRRSFELQSVGERIFKVDGHEVGSDTKVNFNGGKRHMWKIAVLKPGT